MFNRRRFNECIGFAEKVLGADINPHHGYALSLMARAYHGMGNGCEQLLARHKEEITRRDHSK